VHRPDGGRVTGHYDFVYQPLRDAAGAVTGVLQHAVDVTPRVAARAALAAADARFRAVQDASPDGSVVAESVRDDAGRIVDFVHTYVNPAAERLTGRSAAAMLGRRCWNSSRTWPRRGCSTPTCAWSRRASRSSPRPSTGTTAWTTGSGSPWPRWATASTSTSPTCPSASGPSAGRASSATWARRCSRWPTRTR
jgi:PAS domain-containing protein